MITIFGVGQLMAAIRTDRLAQAASDDRSTDASAVSTEKRIPVVNVV